MCARLNVSIPLKVLLGSVIWIEIGGIFLPHSTAWIDFSKIWQAAGEEFSIKKFGRPYQVISDGG